MTGRALCVALVAAFAARAAEIDSLDATAAPDPRLASDSVGIQGTSLSASFEGGKDGKKLTGKGTLALPKGQYAGRVRFDLSVTAAEYDDTTNEARVLHAYDKDPGGTLALGVTWDTFDVRAYVPAFEKVRALCAAHLANKDLKECDTREDLPEAEQKQVDDVAPRGADVIVFARGQITTQYTKYFDPAQNKKLDDLAWPGGFTAGVGIFASAKFLLGFSGGWKLLRDVKSPVQLCQNLPIAGATASPPVLTCSNSIVAPPAWKHELFGRLEIRQYLGRDLGWNPSIGFAGPVDHGTVSFGHSWKFEVPVYFTLSRTKDRSLTVGAAYAHWHDENTSFDDVSVFLTGGFGLIDRIDK
jgi:hypothetical protein